MHDTILLRRKGLNYVSNYSRTPSLQLLLRVFLLSLSVFALLLFVDQPVQAQAQIFGKIINVKSAPYLAKGDGITDDSVAIQQACDAALAQPGSVVYFPNGNYVHGTVIIVNGTNTSLRGQNRATTKLIGTYLDFHANGGSVSGLTFESGAYPLRNYASKSSINNCAFNGSLFIEATDVRVQSCSINNPDAPKHALYVHNSDRVSVNNCQIQSASYYEGSIYVDYCSNFSLRQTKVSCTEDYAIEAYAVNKMLVESCSLIGKNNSIGFYLQFCSDATIRGNAIQSEIQNSYGLYCFESSNLLFANNNVIKALYGIYAYYSPNFQVVANNVRDTDYGVYVVYSDSTSLKSNQISNTQHDGIILTNYAGNDIVAGNSLKNCGLSGGTAVIYVYPYSVPQSLLVQNNIYTGNQQNLGFFIRSYLPAPPAVVKGNITTTMLPTQIDP